MWKAKERTGNRLANAEDSEYQVLKREGSEASGKEVGNRMPRICNVYCTEEEDYREDPNRRLAFPAEGADLNFIR